MIVHLNDVAGVGSLLTKGLREVGYQASLVSPPAGSRLGRHVTRWRAYRAAARRSTFTHIHYALFSAYLTGMDTPLIVHCHGSDVRPNLDRPALRRLTLPGLSRARIVLRSTPDLREPLEKYGIGSTYLPNPVVVPETVGEPEPNTVLLFARLDPFKGAREILEAGRRLASDGASVTVIAWGEFAEEVRADPRGLTVIDRVTPDQVARLLERHAVIIGQIGAGILSVSELEAMAAARPVVMHLRHWTEIEPDPPVARATDANEAYEAAVRILEHPDLGRDLGEAARSWVSETHEVSHVVRRLLEIYAAVGLL